MVVCLAEAVVALYTIGFTLQWCHNGLDSVSNHQPHDCLLNRLFRRRSKKISEPRVTGLCAGNLPGTGEFPAQMASNAENVSIWWRHQDTYPGKAGFCYCLMMCANNRVPTRSQHSHVGHQVRHNSVSKCRHLSKISINFTDFVFKLAAENSWYELPELTRLYATIDLISLPDGPVSTGLLVAN